MPVSHDASTDRALTIERQPNGDYLLLAKQTFPQSPEALFPFFAEARNLERITPALLSFQVLTPEPIEMREGVTIDYRLKIRGVPVRWRSLIKAWEPPHRFIDEQLKGPYRKWHHEHVLEPTDAGGTCMTDRVTYAVPGGALINKLVVERDVRAIFNYRMDTLDSIFCAERAKTC
jgi:ligand-binding SRPBCC domain-containing protein